MSAWFHTHCAGRGLDRGSGLEHLLPLKRQLAKLESDCLADWRPSSSNCLLRRAWAESGMNSWPDIWFDTWCRGVLSISADKTADSDEDIRAAKITNATALLAHEETIIWWYSLFDLRHCEEQFKCDVENAWSLSQQEVRDLNTNSYCKKMQCMTCSSVNKWAKLFLSLLHCILVPLRKSVFEHI